MKRWTKGLLACLVVACMSFVLAGCQQGEYTPEAKSQAVSGSALGKPGTLRVGIIPNTSPLVSPPSAGEYIGIDVDFAYALGDELGLDVELVDVSADPAKALEDGTADVVLGVDTSGDDLGFWCSTPYIQNAVALFGMPSETVIPTTDSDPKIAAQGSKMSSWVVTNLYGSDSLVSTETMAQAFEMLKAGTDSVRYAAAPAVGGLYTVNDGDYSAKIVALLQEPAGYGVGVAEGNTELQEAVTAAVNKLVSGGMMGIIEQKYLGTTVDLSGYTVVKSPTAEAANNSSSSSSSSSSSANAESEADANAEAEGNADEGAEPGAEASEGEGEGEAGAEPAA